MINYNIFSEINLNENFQTCTAMAPLGNPFELL